MCFFRSNRIKHLPIAISHLTQLQQIETLDNPINWPPQDVCNEGLHAINTFITSCLEGQASRHNVLYGSKV